MWVCASPRAWRVIVLLAFAMAPLAPAQLIAGMPASRPIAAQAAPAEPFGLFTVALPYGGILEKWAGVLEKLREEQRVLDACRNDRSRCTNRAANEFLNIVEQARGREGLARLGEINRAINLAIRPVSDLANYGQMDVWATPLQTFARGSGDCEDYAIAKMVALQETGVAPQDLRLVILRDVLHGEDHAVLAVRLDGAWLVLDNRMLKMLRDTQLANFRPTFVIGADGVRAYRDPPPVMQVARSRPEDFQEVAYLVSAQPGLS